MKDNRDRMERGLRFFAAGAGTAAASIGAVHLYAWLSGTMTFRGFETITMKTNSALCLLLCGTALVLTAIFSDTRFPRYAVATMAAFAMTIGLLTLSEHVIGWDLGIDQLLATEPRGAVAILSPNRMGPPGALSFSLCGGALLLLLRGGEKRTRAAQWLGLSLFVIGLFTMLGYLYGVDWLFGAARFTAIAWPTTVAILLLGLGVICVRPREGLMALVTSPDPGGAALRRLLPATLVLPIVLGWLRLEGEWYGLYNRYFGTTIQVVSWILIFSALIYRTGSRISTTATALRRTQSLLLEAERLSHTGAWEWDLPGNFWTFSDEWLSIHGVSKRPRTGEELLLLAHPDDRTPIEEAFRNVALGVRPYEMEHRIVRKDTGELRHVRARGQFVKDKTGRVVRVFGFAQDITETKQAVEALRASEEALRKANDELEERVRERTMELETTYHDLNRETRERFLALENLRESEELLMQQSRLAAMGEMLANIAHQWRQPLNNLALLIQELPLNYDLGEFTKESLDKTVSTSMEIIRHMSHTIESFRTFLQPEKEKELFNVNGAVAKTLSLFDATLKSMRVDLQFNETEQIDIEGHRNQFAQVILNLIANARDAFKEREIESPKLVISLFKEKGKCVVTVADNAGGISDIILDKIFDPYFTTKGKDKGTGIGLFMSRNIVEKSLNGTLTVTNKDGGAEFRVEVSCG